jgi:ATPase family associated with various cellular activities (AAA)
MTEAALREDAGRTSDAPGESLPAALERVYRSLAARQPEGALALAARARVMLPEHDMPSVELQRLQNVFALSAFERDVLVLCAGVELDGRFRHACALAHGDPHNIAPTLGLALSFLEGAHWTSISRLLPLRYWGLVEIGEGALLDAPLRIDERILQYLLGVPAFDEFLEGLVRPLRASMPGREPFAPARLSQALQFVVHRWQDPSARPELVVFTGHDAALRETAFSELCARCGCAPYVLDAADVPGAVRDRERLARAWAREAALSGAALLIGLAQDSPTAGHEVQRLVAWFRGTGVRVALGASGALAASPAWALHVEVPELQAHERKSLWQSCVGPLAQHMNGELDRIVDYFRFDTPGVERCAAALVEQSASSEAPGEIAWHLCRQYARRSLDGLARRIDSRFGWDDLVLPGQQTETLRLIATHVRQRAVVNDTWGFGARAIHGLGLSALFTGTSGTGKTMAASILANELDLDLYQIDLATLVSKYIGETEKNLRRIFDAAEESGAILLFDEADAIFGKRSEVRDSHDRYANLEVSYLLQRIDSYRGVAILTTNMKQAIDSAFLRRFRFIVPFPFPDAALRASIWRRVFPSAAPLDALDFDQLAQLGVSGSVIRNIAVHAAFLAAQQRTGIGAAQILAAARIEYGKLDKPLTAVETKGWT